MKALVTGGTGFLGRAVVSCLRREGHVPVVLTRNPVRADLPGSELLAWNPETEDIRLPEGCDAVIHLAGDSIAHWPWSGGRKQRLWHSRVDLTRRLVEALGQLRSRPAALVSASGLGYFGDAGARPVRAGDPPGGDFLARMAQAWEREALAARNLGMRVAVLRLGMVLGREGGVLPRLALPFRLGLGAVLGSGEQYWPWIHREDAAALFCRAAFDAAYSGPFLAAAGEPLTQRAFARALAVALRRPLLFRVPAFALRFPLGEMADLMLHGQRAAGDAPGFAPRFAALPEALRGLLSPMGNSGVKN